MPALILIAVLLLAYSNGANDNFKGVATLFGSGTTNYRQALAWATLTTFAGSMLALLLAHGLVDSFKGKGLVPDEVTLQPAFLMAVSLGAGLTVLLATWTGLPVSTTHALTGGLVGAGLLATGGDVQFNSLLSAFLLPLLCSPVIAMLLTLVAYPAFRIGRRALGITSQTCLCVGAVYEPVRAQPDGSMALERTGVALETGHGCRGDGTGRHPQRTPCRRDHEPQDYPDECRQGFTANLVKSLLVTLASRFGLPVSTTHVSVGALFGFGTVNGSARLSVIFTILLAWVTTLPLGALFAASAYWLLQGVG